MGNYSFSDEAVKDIEDICDYLARDNPRTAGKIFDAIRQKCKLVANFPKMGKAYPQLACDLRGFVVENYIVFLLSERGRNNDRAGSQWLSGSGLPLYGRVKCGR